MTEHKFWTAALLASLLAAAFAAEVPKDPIDRQHHAALAEKDKDIEILKQALAKARADAQRCQEMGEPKKTATPDLPPSRAATDK